MKVFPLNNWGGAKRHRSRSSRGLSVRLLPNASTQPPERFAISGDWKFSRWKCSGTRPLLRLESPGRAPEGSPGKRGAGAPGPLSPLAAPWVSVPTDFLLSPRIAHHWAIREERPGEGGRFAAVSRFVGLQMFLGLKNDLRERARVLPPHPDPEKIELSQP